MPSLIFWKRLKFMAGIMQQSEMVEKQETYYHVLSVIYMSLCCHCFYEFSGNFSLPIYL